MKKIRKLPALLLFCTCLLSSLTYSQDNTSFNKKEFYAAMASKDGGALDSQLDVLGKANFSDKAAFEGALIMKKAGFVKGASKKLKLFKEGHKKLEAAISKEQDNAEFRFLRLMIQENAPGILGYKDDLDKDSTYIRQSFKQLPTVVQQAIAKYSKTSKVLRSEDF